MKTDSSPSNTNTSASGYRWLLWGGLLLFILALASFAQRQISAGNGAKSHDCDLQLGSCQQDGFNLSFGPTPIQSLQPLTLTLAATDDDRYDQVTADLQGADMYMGQNQFILEQTEDNLWQANTELAVCTTGSMKWRLTVSLTHNGTTQQHQFEFKAQ